MHFCFFVYLCCWPACSELRSSWCLSSLSIRCLSSDSFVPRRVSSSMVRLWSWRRYSAISSWLPRIASWLDLAASDKRSMRTVENKDRSIYTFTVRYFAWHVTHSWIQKGLFCLKIFNQCCLIAQTVTTESLCNLDTVQLPVSSLTQLPPSSKHE